MSVQSIYIALWDSESVQLLNEVHVGDIIISIVYKKDELILHHNNTCTCKHSSGAILGQASGYKTNGY